MEKNNVKITYSNTLEPILNDRKKPTNVLMDEYPLDMRKEKFFEFCRKFDLRNDPILRDNFQMFSHRLHWDEHPYTELMHDVKSFRDKLWYTIVFSFTNEHWLTLMTLAEGGLGGMQERFVNERHARSDLFQIYYPKGTIVKEWLCDVPLQAANDMSHHLENRRKPFSMMEFATLMCNYFKANHGFRAPMYPCKNLSRYLAMAHPELIDPETYIHPGTGSFDGFYQVFGGSYLFARAKFKLDGADYVPVNKHGETLLEQFHSIQDDYRNPILRQQYINIEDKMCFFYKHIAISHGIKQKTPKIPYEWIFPTEFSLRKEVQ